MAGFTPRIRRRAQVGKFLRNQQIRVSEVMVIVPGEGSLGVMGTRKALSEANMRGLDLVLVSPNAKPPIAKIVDWGNFKYEQDRHERETKRENKVHDDKIVQISYKMGENEVGIRFRKAYKFLEKGHRVQVKMRLKGRERQFVPLAAKKMDGFIKSLAEVGVTNKTPMHAGGTIMCELKPIKK